MRLDRLLSKEKNYPALKVSVVLVFIVLWGVWDVLGMLLGSWVLYPNRPRVGERFLLAGVGCWCGVWDLYSGCEHLERMWLIVCGWLCVWQ